MVATVQRAAPGFTAASVVKGELKDVSLSDLLGQWVVLLFYPMDFTFVCPTEILAFNDAVEEFKKIGAVVLGISTDSQYAHLAWSTQPRKLGGLASNDSTPLALPLVADKNMKISREYGVLIEEEGIALRGLFLIDPNGTLRQSTINDLPVGRSVDETLRLLKAFQFTDKHGEVCPANWTEGSKTIKAEPTKSLEYFNAANAVTNGSANGTAMNSANASSPPKKRARVD